MNKNRGFTLAEVLVTLAIIGVLAAILFPSILANYTERTLNAKRQALFGRMSQAMGELADQYRNYGDVDCDNPNDLYTCTDVGSAVKFISQGLSKVYKVSAVCDNTSLSACDIPESVTLENGDDFKLHEKGSSLFTYNKQIHNSDRADHPNVPMIPYDTQSAGFMTKNGESILLFYNPNCGTKLTQTTDFMLGETFMCVNMVYDLNGGKQKPNKVGEDIGFMTVFYNDTPYLTAPRPYDWKAVPDYEATTDGTGAEYISSWKNPTYLEAKAACQALGDNVGLPSLEEALSMAINRELWAPSNEQKNSAAQGYGSYMWTSTMMDPTHAAMVYLISTKRFEITNWNHVFTYYYDINYTSTTLVRCVYKD